jgi:hypothetical integral membrane protein (TIGR02206 family)
LLNELLHLRYFEVDMIQYFVKDYAGAPFELFGTAHLIALACVVLVNLLIVIFRKKFTPKGQQYFRYITAAILLFNETAWHLWNYFTGQWTLQTMLPLHLCSVLVFVSAIMLITKSYAIYEFAYFLGIAGATQALLTPDAGIYGYPHFRFFQIFISHGAIVTSAIYMTLVEGFRPYWKSLKHIFLWGNVYMAVIFVFNLLIGSNYLFIAHKPETASLIDVLPAWPWYILALEGIAVIMCLLLYIPFIIRDSRSRKTASIKAV